MIKAVLQTQFPNLGAAAVTSTAASLSNGGIPIGGIIIWSGAANAVPANWQICNGTNGTPNLMGQFVMGASDGVNPPAPLGIGSAAVGQTSGGTLTATGTTDVSGDHSHTTSTIGDHNHPGSQAAFTLTAANLPPHTHEMVLTVDNGTNNQNAVAYAPAGSGEAGGTVDFGPTGSGNGVGPTEVVQTLAIVPDGTHNHTALSDAEGSGPQVLHQHAVSATITPIYYALCYIMRVS